MGESYAGGCYRHFGLNSKYLAETARSGIKRQKDCFYQGDADRVTGGE
jgi:hypothetical protein